MKQYKTNTCCFLFELFLAIDDFEYAFPSDNMWYSKGLNSGDELSTKSHCSLRQFSLFTPTIGDIVGIPPSIWQKQCPVQWRQHSIQFGIFTLFWWLWNANTSRSDDTYRHQWTRSPLVQAMACRLFDMKPIPVGMLKLWNIFGKIESLYKSFSPTKCISKYWSCAVMPPLRYEHDIQWGMQSLVLGWWRRALVS